MAQKITIEPVTRIEGHAKVTIRLDDSGKLESARLHVNEFRGFERFCEGRLFHEMPLITERICGICPVSHHLTSAKAGDAILGVEPPRPAQLLRELMHMGQTIQSHAMHFFMLAGPDLILGADSAPALRNVAGLYQADPQLTVKAIRLRKFGQEIIERLGERRVHPNFAIPGGVNKALAVADRDAILAGVPEMLGFIKDGLAILKTWAGKHADEMRRFAVFSSGYLGMVDENDAVQLYDGDLRLVDSKRKELERFKSGDYLDYIAEHVESWSYLKFPYYRRLGWPAGTYRVGPLGRLNAAKKMATPLAQQEYVQYQQAAGGGVVEGSLYYHYARLIEAVYALERVQQLLSDPDILSKDLRATAGITNREGVGVLEAPRGTLWHHYWVDENGVLEKVNLIVATGHNNYAMSRGVEEVARSTFNGGPVTEGMLNRIEMVVRAYDPCLSCSTHAVGQMPLMVEVRGPENELLEQHQRPALPLNP
ncbi:MAG: Ni/Fe hydrogenase subunit alpha [Limisphaerales bacterium]